MASREPAKKLSASELRDAINAHYKRELIVLGSDERLEVSYIPTGLLPFDVILGGGIPRGRLTMLVGAFSSLKSYVALNAIRQVQQDGGTAALIDTERTYDPEWARSLGVNTDDLFVWPAPGAQDLDVTGERAIDIAGLLLRNKVDLLVFDSITAALPQGDVDKQMAGERTAPGQLARMMSDGLRRLTAANTHTAIIFTSQIREQVGVTFGNPETATGGRAPGFYSSLILNIRPMDKIKRSVKQHNGEKWIDTQEIVGRRMKITLEKSKLSAPWRDTIFIWDMTRSCIDEESYIFAQAVELGIVSQGGSRWTFGETTINGRENFITKMREDREMLTAMRGQVLQSRCQGSLPRDGA